ncbi:chemotaxis protein CheD [Sunxiuqinia indica]|uniref:chemotaxis protein CheD n=1 Tax=Sunxiuqinia indica TaxID=2692584 RepID=UPI001F489575|nr:chemotaxis protein CheD [Sunxiuqinia indica]
MLVDLKTYYLHQSRMIVSEEPLTVNTVLGSCVSVCMFDTEFKIGGINHFMLPLWNGEGLESPRFGNVAIPKLIDELLRLGATKENLIAKVFGGAMVLVEGDSHFRTGERNLSVAFRLLNEYNIPMVASSTGGNRGRKILFDTSTGKVQQKYLNKR